MTKQPPVYIVSNGRPNHQLTYKSLRRSGYSGDIYIIVDDLDPTVGEYKSIYGDSVIVFNKYKYMEKCDSLDNFNVEKTALYAKVASHDIAESMGHENFVVTDDDVQGLDYRYIDDGKLKSKPITDLDALFGYVWDFHREIGACTLSFAMPNVFLGGASSLPETFLRTANCIYFCDVNNKGIFKGTFLEDHLHILLSQQIGKRVVSLPYIQILTVPIRSNRGGLYETYHETFGSSREYIEKMYGVIACPSCCAILANVNGVQLRTDKRHAYPEILGEEVKK